MTVSQDTIFALASAYGRSGVAVLRVSGPKAFESLQRLSGRDVPSSHQAQLMTLRDPLDGVVLDQALVLAFEGPKSYTGEDVVEYHLHGSIAVIEAMLKVLGACEGHRLAEPGEFTRRAFENDKMDLTEAEAVADLIDAQTSVQKEQALSQMGGSLYRLYEDWTERLKKVLAHLEADIEFPDEDDLNDQVSLALVSVVSELLAGISAHLNDNRRGEMLRDGIHVAVVGAPNAGKSSLVNALAQREVAIVSETEGTTRDIIEVHLDIAGFPVILSDTAGLRPEQLGGGAHDKIESEGIRRALERARSADLTMLVFDSSLGEPHDKTLSLADERSLLVANKSDLIFSWPHEGFVSVSAKSEAGLDSLLLALAHKIKELIAPRGAISSGATITRVRHRKALEEAQANLGRALEAEFPELMAEEMRLAIRAIGRITGRVDVEDLLDVIFNDFCIGK